MNIYTNMLFQQGYLRDPRFGRDADEETSYAEGYGNHVASAKAFAPLGHVHPAELSAAPTSHRTTTFASDPCPLGTCG